MVRYLTKPEALDWLSAVDLLSFLYHQLKEWKRLKIHLLCNRRYQAKTAADDILIFFTTNVYNVPRLLRYYMCYPRYDLFNHHRNYYNANLPIPCYFPLQWKPPFPKKKVWTTCIRRKPNTVPLSPFHDIVERCRISAYGSTTHRVSDIASERFDIPPQIVCSFFIQWIGRIWF